MLSLFTANLDANKWNDLNYLHLRLVEDLFEVIDQHGLKIHDVRNTYQADHAQKNGNIAESAIDHVYTRYNKEVIVTKLENSSSDHLPVICKLNTNDKKETNSRTIMIAKPCTLLKHL